MNAGTAVQLDAVNAELHVVSESIEETPVEEPGVVSDVMARVHKSMAVANYIREMKRFEAASQSFNEACQRVRQTVGKNQRFVTKHEYEHFLVVSDEDGSFEVSKIDFV